MSPKRQAASTEDALVVRSLALRLPDATQLEPHAHPWGQPLARLARGSGASVRTLERLFREETGLTFERWRQQLRVLVALEHLAAGQSVTDTALAVGFRGTSAFIAMFKRTLGSTPGKYFRDAPNGG